MPAIEIIGSLVVALLIWKGGGQVISQAISLGVLVAFLSYASHYWGVYVVEIKI